MKHLLFWIYLSAPRRCSAILVAPKTALTFYIFAVALGLHLAGDRAADRGPRRQAVRRALSRDAVRPELLSHQIGGFFGAWLGGIAVAQFGDYNWMWYADALLATAAALINLPIREAPVVRVAAAA